MFFNKKKLTIGFVIGCLLFSRFVKINWGDGFFFHPDENNMARAITNLSNTNLDPHFYAYGQFPLYLVYFIFRGVTLKSPSFAQAVLGLRLTSAVFSCLTIYCFYLLSKEVFRCFNDQIIFLLFLIFSPGLIQIAHFGTTESILVFVFVFDIYLAFLLKRKYQFKYLIWAGIITGVGVATKITALVFTLPIIIALKFSLLPTVYYLLITLMTGIGLSPYSLINFPDFLSSMRYETGVARGATKVFYTNQFLSTKPYWFQIKNIFPYVVGLPVFIFSCLGLIKIRHHRNFKTIFSFFLLPSLIYFLYFGQLYVKWTRFMAPIFVVFPLLAAYWISQLKSKSFKSIMIILAILPGIIFLNLYLRPDIRLSASQWMDENLNDGSVILSEAGNIVDLPLNTSRSFMVRNFDFYNLENSPDKLADLYQYVERANYILVPSRRVFKNQTGSRFPSSSQYYQDLFSGQLGFSLVKTFQTPNYFILDPENAEETWTVFDQPKIRLYARR
ncbi:MAG TPA: glycosyltransferase family 39 protein [Candidatus Woesebacteria bacterium]|nr:glycosyltransferase family 39 protein [Candidatus Woesebacteria bacterium]HRS22533.1 glycosyltransferase family 39 protein [Candidatus Woesebacteria bacterium]HRT39878.1 glycosyltransferase family 39 protein [Candidatus Woesebacteria bacterium]